MVDTVESVVGESTAGTSTTTTPETVPVPLVDNEGNLRVGWTDILDEDLRDNSYLKEAKNIQGMARSTVSARSMVGKNMMEIPTDASSEVVWDTYYKAGGKPETVADYNLKAPDGFPEEVIEQVFPKVRLDAWQDRFFKAGISKKAADKFIADYAQDMLVDLQSVKQVEEQEMSELEAGLVTDWGAAYEQKKHLGNIAMEEAASTIKNGETIVNEEFRARLIEKAGNDPDIIRAFANLGSKFAEGKSPNFTNVPTPADYQTQIDEITANPLYLKGTRKERMKLAEQVMALRTKMAETKA